MSTSQVALHRELDEVLLFLRLTRSLHHRSTRAKKGHP